MAIGIARTRGIRIDEEVSSQQVKAVIAMALGLAAPAPQKGIAIIFRVLKFGTENRRHLQDERPPVILTGAASQRGSSVADHQLNRCRA